MRWGGPPAPPAASGGSFIPRRAQVPAISPQRAGPQLQAAIDQVLPAIQADPRLAAWLLAQSLGVQPYATGPGWTWAQNRPNGM